MKQTTRIGTVVAILTIIAYWTLPSNNLMQPQRAFGQAAEENTAEIVPRMELDLVGLLKSERVMSNMAEGAIWKIAPGAGRILIQVPFNVVADDDAPVEYTNSTVKLSGAQHLTFLLDDFGENNELLELARRDAAEVNTGSRRLAREKERDPIFVQPQAAKKFTVTPDGEVQYKMERVIRNADIHNKTSLFSMKINRQLLNDERPDRPNNSGDRAAQAAAAAEYRIKNAEFLDLMRTVNGLPTDLVCPLPTRVWAVYEMSAAKRDLLFTGDEPYPWRIEMDTFQMLRDLCKEPVKAEEGYNGIPQLPPHVQTALISMSELAQDDHPYSKRAVALTLRISGLIKYAQFGDTQFFLLQQLIKDGDAETRNIVMSQLARVIPPTRASRELLKLMAVQAVKAGSEGTVTALETLVGTFRNNADPNSAQDMIGPANNMLSDENGAPPSKVLEQLVSLCRDQPAIVPMLSKNIRFYNLPEKRMSESLIYIVENAGAEPVCAAWLDEQFLSSANTDMLSRALQVIANADTGARDLGPAVNWAVERLFGPPRTADGDQIERKARMRLPIPIYSTRNGIYRSLQQGDRNLRSLAWRALPRFTMPLALDADGNPIKHEDQRYRALLDAALDQIPTPTEAVNFLATQPDKGNASRCLVQIVLRGSRDASVGSVRALVGSGAPIGDMLNELGPGERQGFAMLVYQIMTRRAQPPLVVNVLRRRDTINPVAAWFGDEVAKGTLPGPGEWATQFAGDDPLLELAMSRDTDLAKGACAVLVASVGGGDRTALALLQSLRNLADQRPASVRETWLAQKQTIRATQLAQHEGHYQMVMQLYDSIPANADAKPAKEVIVGTVQLLVNTDDQSVSFAGQATTVEIPDESNTIRLAKPAELKSLPNEELAALPLEKVTEPVYLRRGEDGTWRGSMKMEGIARTILLLKPVTNDDSTARAN